MPKTNEKIYFSPDLNERERACFESGIKLGALYHILCGIPITSEEKIINSIEKGIESAISCQPYVQSVKITLDKGNIKGNKSTEFDYDEISGKIVHAELTLKFATIEVLAKIDWIEDLQYPLMYIEKIHEINKN